jgi:hypothetical protein
MEEQKELRTLIPRNYPIKIVGKLIYSESHQSWNTIRIRKEIIQKFPQLKEKSSSFCYKMNMYSSYKELISELKIAEKSGEAVPLTLMLCRVREN